MVKTREEKFILGDEAVLKEVYEEYSPLLMGLSRRLVGPDAEDLLQNVFLSAWKSREKYNPEKGSLRAWLCGITRFRAIDLLRKKGKGEAYSTDFSEPINDFATDETAEVETVVDSIVVDQALLELSGPKREVVELGFKGGLSHSEIALKLTMPIGTVKSHMRRGLEVLQRELGGSREPVI